MAAPALQVEPFSVKHKYSGKWDDAKSTLTTCDPDSYKFVTDKDDKQEVKEHAEVIFTYDVAYKVRPRPAGAVVAGCGWAPSSRSARPGDAC